ncbi:unnamed protein product [Lactuca virosa]|uniref:Uncharacterized protein n=1 Tax=Lactuca virosa TaxID=75947 RepID=A0AAU9LL20_9ASTR|nr:unnamed protein product [Lactuca virosa]
MKSSTPGRFRHPWFGGVTVAHFSSLSDLKTIHLPLSDLQQCRRLHQLRHPASTSYAGDGCSDVTFTKPAPLLLFSPCARFFPSPGSPTTSPATTPSHPNVTAASSNDAAASVSDVPGTIRNPTFKFASINSPFSIQPSRLEGVIP